MEDSSGGAAGGITTIKLKRARRPPWVARIAPVLSKLELSTSSPQFNQVPTPVKGDATKCQKALTKLQAEAKSKSDGSSAPNFSIEDLDDVLQRASDAYTSIKDMLKSIKK